MQSTKFGKKVLASLALQNLGNKYNIASLFKNGLVICIPLLVDNFTLFSKRIFVLRTIYLDCRNNPEFGYHFLFVCKNENIITLRNKYLPNYYRVYPNHAKFEGLLSICNTELYKRLSICIRKAAALF